MVNNQIIARNNISFATRPQRPNAPGRGSKPPIVRPAPFSRIGSALSSLFDRIGVPGALAADSGLAAPVAPREVYDDRFTIVQDLSRTVMSRVCRARDNLLGRTVVLKLSTERQMDRYLEREAAIMSNRQLGSLPDLYGFGWYRGDRCIVMEEISGVTLRAFMAERHSLPEKIDVLRQVLLGLGALRRFARVAHRDIKPDNIMVQGDGRVRLIDVGLAVEIGSSPGPGGTAGYAPIEQLIGGRVDQRSDIYSLGLVAYELLSGSHPQPLSRTERSDWERIIPLRINSRIPRLPAGALEPDRQSLGERFNEVHSRLSDIVGKMTRVRPDHRYEIVGEVLSDLRRVSRLVEEAAAALPG